MYGPYIFPVEVIRIFAYTVYERYYISLREIRTSRNLTQRELSQKSGVNYRSLQDYEQGHKKLLSANGDVLLHLSTVLKCSIEDFLLDDMDGAPLLSSNQLDTELIQAQRFFCEKYQTYGRWIFNNNQISTLFYYEGQRYTIPFSAIFTNLMLPFLKDAAVLQMEAKIEELILANNGFESW